MSGPDADDFDARLREDRAHLEEVIRREAFVQGFVAARDPKNPMETLQLCAEADQAYTTWRSHR